MRMNFNIPHEEDIQEIKGSLNTKESDDLVKTGCWEELELCDDLFYPVCSECGYMPRDYKTLAICPYCGAHMAV